MLKSLEFESGLLDSMGWCGAIPDDNLALHDHRARRPVITFEAVLSELHDMKVHGFNRIADRC